MNAIRHYRQQRGMTMRELAIAADVIEVTISRKEREEQLTGQIDVLRRIAGALGLKLSELVAFEEKGENKK